MALVTKIKEYREKAGMKQAELAERVNARRETIVHQENGRYNPSLKLAMDIANSGVTLAGLIPWSIAISVPLSMLDVGNEAIPWCILLYMIPLCYLFTKRCFRASRNPAVERT